MKRFRPRLTYANVIASLALFVALGGSAVAAGLAKNSVGPNQLKKGAVTGKAIRKQAVTAGKIAPKAVVAGKLGANAVLPGNLGAGIISTDKISASAVTAAKIAPEVLNNVQTLKSGQTLRGVFSLGGTKAVTTKASAFGAISFQQPLVASPVLTVIVPKGGPFTTQCPGLGGGGTTPEATGGVACVYLTAETNLEGVGPAAVTQETSRLGVNLTAIGKEADAGNFVASGVWAVTAP